MKKVLAWVLALALVLSSFAMSFAYTDDADIAKDGATTAVRVLSALGVIEGYKDGSFKPDKVVTRAEMAALVVRAMGFDSNKGNLETPYKDVAKGDWYSGVIKYATDLGLIKGYADGTFKPNQSVTYFEAITMILRSLGYRDEYLIGDWPANFVNQAEELGTYNKWFNVSTENFSLGAKRADCAIMIYNTLTTCMVTYDKFDRGALTLPDNYLKRLGDIDLMGGTIEMDDISIGQGVLGYEDLGARVEIGFIKGGAIVDVILDSSYELIPYADFEAKRVAATDKAYYFENGYVDFANPDAAGENGVPKSFDYAYVKKSGKKYVDVWSYVSWDADDTHQWEKNDALILAKNQTLLATPKDHNGFDGLDAYGFKQTNEEVIDDTYYFLEGADSLDAIEAGSIVTFYAGVEQYIGTDEDGIDNGPDGTPFAPGDSNAPIVSYVGVGTDVVEGTIEDTIGTTVVIDGEKYTVENADLYPSAMYADNWTNYACKNFDPEQFGVGDTVKAYFNDEGYIAKWDAAGGTAWQYAIYEDAQANHEHFALGMQWTYQYYLHQANDEDAWIDLAAGMKKSDINNPGLFAYEIGLVVRPVDQLVAYKTDEDGAIVKADFGAKKLVAPAKLEVNGKLAGYIVDEDVVIFAKEDYTKGADYDVFGYDVLDGLTLAAGTEYYVDGDVITAIKVNTAIADTKAKIDIVKGVTKHGAGYYEVEFIDGTVEETVDLNIDSAIANGAYKFAYVQYNTDGKIKAINQVATTGADVVGTKLASGQVSEFFAKFGGTKSNAGIDYLVGDVLKIAYPITGATVYAWDGEALSAGDINLITKGAPVTLIRTVSEGNVWDIVIYNSNSKGTAYYI